MKIEFRELQTRRIVNTHKHVDGPWFWVKYTAHPYIGCRSGCRFCYLRGSKYLGQRDPASFDRLIQVKTNAVDRLRRELPRLAADVIAAGDWQQPAEDRYRLSQGMLQVVLEAGFPLFIVERSPRLLRDLDLLVEINRRTWVGVLISISSLDQDLKQAFEPRSPGVRRRLQLMERLAQSGISVGTALMPVIPLLGDQRSQLEDLVVATRDHGGSCVVAGGLTMDGTQADHALQAAIDFDPSIEAPWKRFYNWGASGKPAHGPPAPYAARLGLEVRRLCAKHRLGDRLPRYIAPGPLSINKRIAERLFLRTYDLELEQAPSAHIWAVRRAAWTIDELDSSVGEIYAREGSAGLQTLPGIGDHLAPLIGGWLKELSLPLDPTPPPNKLMDDN